MQPSKIDLSRLAEVLIFLGPRYDDGDPMWYALSGDVPWSASAWEQNIERHARGSRGDKEGYLYILYDWLRDQGYPVTGESLFALEQEVMRQLKAHGMRNPYFKEGSDEQ